MTVKQQFKALFQNIGNAFSEFNASDEFRFSSDSFVTDLDFETSALQRFIEQADGGADRINALADLQRVAKASTVEYAKTIEDFANHDLGDFIKQNVAADVSLQAQSNSFSAIRPIINEYKTGLQATRLTTDEFIDAVARSNPQLANYLRTTQQTDVSMKGYVGTLVKTRLGMIATQAAATAMNAAISMGISFLIQLGASLIQKGWEYLQFQLKSSAEKIEIFNEKLSQTQTTIKETMSSFRSLSSNAQEIIPRFAKLSNGVNSLGENVSLTDEEYKEFLDLSNKIADMFPELNLGMDDNGNAMLALSYAADSLTDSLWELVKAQRAEANEKIAKNFVEDADVTWKKVMEIEKQRYDLYKQLENETDANKRAGIEKQIAQKVKEANNAQNEINKVASAWAQTNPMYATLGNEAQSIVQRMVESFDFYQIELTSAKQMQNYIERGILQPLYNAEPEVKAGIEKITDWRSQLKSGKLSVEEFSANVEKAFDDLFAGIDPDEVHNFEWAFIQAFESAGISGNSFKEVVAGLIEEYSKISPAAVAAAKAQAYEITALSDSLSSYKSALDLIKSAEAEMEDGGLSVETVKSLADSTENYIDFLYEENGVIKLNTDAYREYAKAALRADIVHLQESVDKLKAQKEAIETMIASLSGEGASVVLASLSRKLEECDTELQNNERQLALWQAALNEAENSVEEVTEEVAEMVEVLDFSNMTSGLSSIESGVKDIYEAIDKLHEGTALTSEELSDLALKYPKLLEAANLFSDGTIEGQEKALNYILDSYETEYDGLLDTKIAELKATNQMLTQQIDLENQKKNKVIEIADLQSNGKFDSEAEYARLLKELQDLEGQNFVTYSDGILVVNKQMLEEQLVQDSDKVENSKAIWEKQGDLIVDAHVQGQQEALKTYPTFLSRLSSWTEDNLNPFLRRVATNVKKAFNGDDSLSNLNTAPGSPWIGTDYEGNKVTLNTKVKESKFTIDDKSVDEWAKQYQDIISQRIQTITDQIGANEIVIENLQSLKGLTLDRLYHTAADATGTSSESDKEETEEEIEEAVEETIEAFDYIAIAISRAQRAAEQMKKAFSSTYNTLQERSNAFKNSVSALNQELSVQNLAANQYLNAANAVAISDDIKAMVREGAIQIAQYNSDTAKLINEYQDLYEKYLSCIDAASDLRDEISALYSENFNNVQKDFDNQLNMIAHKANTVQKQIEIVQNNGYILTREYYDQLIEIEYERLRALQTERDQLQRSLDEAVKTGEIKTYSEAWYEMQSAINEVDEALQDCDITLNGFYGDIGKLADDAFDRAIDQFDALIDEANFLIDIMENDGKLTDSTTGKLTPAGNATIDLHNYNYQVYLAEAQKLASELDRLNQLVAENPTNIDLIERRNELLQKQRQSILAAQNEKKALRSLVEEGLKSENDAIKKNIKAYEDYLDELADVRSYQKQINDDNSAISKIQKQLVAYANDNSDESKARIQKLQTELQAAIEKKDDDEFSRMISEQKKMLSNLESDIDDQMNARLDNIDSYLSQSNMSLSDISSILWGISTDIASLVSISDPITSGTIPHYASGGMNYRTGLAWLDGTPSKPEMVLNAADTANFLALRDSLRNFSTQSVTPDMLAAFHGMTVNHNLPSMASGSFVSTSNHMGGTNATYSVNIAIDHVENYDDFVAQMKKDGKFEKMIQSMTIGRAAGRGALDKYKY